MSLEPNILCKISPTLKKKKNILYKSRNLSLIDPKPNIFKKSCREARKKKKTISTSSELVTKRKPKKRLSTCSVLERKKDNIY